MSERLVFRFLWLIVMGLIVSSAMVCLIGLYSGVLKLITQQFESAGTALGLAALSGVTCWVLCRHCDDLIDRRRT
jgi:hypothetical protein